jgi:transposase InsO family protein
VWDQSGLVAALNNLSTSGWVIDTGATSHMASEDGIFLHLLPLLHPSYVTVGNGSCVTVDQCGDATLTTPSSNFGINNVLFVPALIKNLLSVRKFTHDNPCTFEFDSDGFSIKDRRTRCVICRFNSDGDLYTIPPPSPMSSPHTLLSIAAAASTWQQRLGHPGLAVLHKLQRSSSIVCNTIESKLCHACQLGKHMRLPFASSTTSTSHCFELVHCDVWASPVISNSDHKYYLLILDDFSHYCWVFPMKHKSDVHSLITKFLAYARTQFSASLKALQADNGTEFINSATTSFLAQYGVQLCLSCTYTSPQNGTAERMLRTLNNSVRTLLFHASMPTTFWVEALHAACLLINRLP